MKRLIVLSCTLALLFASCAGFCSDYYVNVNTGNDANSGLSPQDAWKTITYATSVIEASADEGSVIHVAPGTYSPSTGEVFPLGGRVAALEGEDPETVIIDAQRTDAVFSYPSAISGVTIRGGYTDYMGGGVRLMSAYGLLLDNRLYGRRCPPYECVWSSAGQLHNRG